MSNENEPKPPQSNTTPEPEHPAKLPAAHHLTQAERDEEIEAISQHSRKQHPGIECPPDRPPVPPRKAALLAGVVLLVLLAAGGFTLLDRLSHSRVLARETEQSAVPTVGIVHPLAEKPDVELVLPGSLLAFKESPIYARTNGYLLRWYKDIGSQVKKGELLAQIDTPEVDQELNQARATQQQMQAQMELAKITAARWENLRKTDSVSAQEADQQSSAYTQSQANLAAAEANVRRLEELESFKNVYAPFTGVLTQRNVDPGALINAGAGGKELFDFAQVDTLRVFVSVPQAYAPFIKAGVNAAITLQELPGQKFDAKVARTAEAIDPATRTLLTEVDVLNRDGRLLPGSFGEVHFAVGANVRKLTVPVNAMLFRSAGAQVAVVGPDHKIELRALNIGKDYGTALEVLGGLTVNDQIVVNPPDSLEQGQQVNVAQPAAQPDGQPQAAQQKGKRLVTQRQTMFAALLALLGLTAGCTVGPHYQRPAATAPPAVVPSAWKTDTPWQPAAPKDAIPKGAWWQVYHDPTLDAYEQQLLAANQSLAAARDRLEQARSLARVATSALFPQASADPSVLHEGAGANRPLNGAPPPASPYIQQVYTVPFSLSYEPDLFGSVRHGVEAANATLQSTAADLQNAQLVLTAELAADYFSLRESDAEYQVVEELVGYESKGMELVNDRHNGGIASGLEVAQQAALLDATRSQLALVRQSRAQYEHAIAALLGTPAPGFAVAAAPLTATPPPVPLGVPSDVLERRPDIASYERQIAYANAQIGIATAAFYPHITLGATGGWQSRDIATLANAPSLFWSLGADALQPIFEGGRNRANLAAARSSYDASVADYRESVLTAFQQVEDGISNLQTLEQAATTQAAAVEDARRELAIANNRYVGGVDTYLDVITAQSTLLTSERLAAQLQGQRMVSSVYLVKALGGGWQASDLNSQRVHPHAGQFFQP